MNFTLSWPHAYAFERVEGILKRHPEDFKVVERLPEVPGGEGEHLWLTVEKINQNTAWVAKQIAKWAGVNPRLVSYAGLKDRQAVTLQTFSVHLPGQESPSISDLNIEGVKVVDSTRHSKKLRTGQLIGNEFSIRVREVDQSHDLIERHWNEVCQQGIPNYFGPQRFGRQGRNVSDGSQWLLGEKKLPKHLQSICLSAVRSYLFNQLLAQRIRDGNWNQLIAGDFAQFNAGKSGFYCESLETADIERCIRGEISPSASLPGESRDSFDALDDRERAILQPYEPLIEALINKRVARHFRKMRVFPERPSLCFVDGDPVFSFFLPAGCYATAVMTELFNWQLGLLSSDWNE